VISNNINLMSKTVLNEWTIEELITKLDENFKSNIGQRLRAIDDCLLRDFDRSGSRRSDSGLTCEFLLNKIVLSFNWVVSEGFVLQYVPEYVQDPDQETVAKVNQEFDTIKIALDELFRDFGSSVYITPTDKVEYLNDIRRMVGQPLLIPNKSHEPCIFQWSVGRFEVVLSKQFYQPGDPLLSLAFVAPGIYDYLLNNRLANS